MQFSNNITFISQRDVFFQIFDNLDRSNLSKLELTSKLFYEHVQNYIPYDLARFPHKLDKYTGNTPEIFERFFKTLIKPYSIKHFCPLNQKIGKTLKDDSVLLMIERMPNLTSIHLHNTLITTKTIKALSTLPFLTHLNLNHCKFIHQQSFYATIGRLTQLTQLKMKNNPAITENALREIHEKLTQLTYLDIRGGNTLCSETVPLLKERGVEVIETPVLSVLTSDFITYKVSWLSQ